MFLFNNIMGSSFIFNSPFSPGPSHPGSINPLSLVTYNLSQIPRISAKPLFFMNIMG